MKVLITGATGQLGRELVHRAPAGATVKAVSHGELDIADEGAVRALVAAFAPTAIINAAAYTNVDGAETAPEVAERANARGPRVLALAAAARGAHLVHVSTDYVFDGNASSPYAPADLVWPLSIYGHSKRRGEEQVLAAAPAQSTIVRTAWVYAAHGRNFVTRMLELMGTRPSLRVVGDQIGAPTAAFGLADVLWGFVAAPAAGIFHWSDAGVASWYDFAVAIHEEGLARGLVPARLRIESIPSSAYPTPAKRPRFSLLERSSTEQALGRAAVHWRVNLRSVLDEIVRSRAT